MNTWNFSSQKLDMSAKHPTGAASAEAPFDLRLWALATYFVPNNGWLR
jgi:hypothetical protein